MAAAQDDTKPPRVSVGARVPHDRGGRSPAAFFGSDKIPVTLDSRVTATSRRYERFSEIVREVNRTRVLVGFHFRSSDDEGSHLGRKVGRFVVERFFRRRP